MAFETECIQGREVGGKTQQAIDIRRSIMAMIIGDGVSNQAGHTIRVNNT